MIGDTPHDIECARHFGAVAVAVATGLYRRDELEAEGPDLLFDDFSDVEDALSSSLSRYARDAAERRGADQLGPRLTASPCSSNCYPQQHGSSGASPGTSPPQQRKNSSRNLRSARRSS